MQSRRRAHLGIAGAVLVWGLSLAVLWPETSDGIESLALGRPAPDFRLTDLDGHQVSLQSLRGKNVLLYFSSTRCPASIKNYPLLLDLANEHAAEAAVEFFAVHSRRGDHEPLNPAEIRVQTRIMGQGFPSLLDMHGDIAMTYRAAEAPAFVIIDSDGIVRYHGLFDDSRESELIAIEGSEILEQLLDPVRPEVAIIQTRDTSLR